MDHRDITPAAEKLALTTLIAVLNNKVTDLKAYKLGLIDADGTIKRRPRSDEEKKAFSNLVSFMAQLKPYIEHKKNFQSNQAVDFKRKYSNLNWYDKIEDNLTEEQIMITKSIPDDQAHGVEMIYMELQAMTFKQHDPMEAAGTYDPKTGEVTDLPRVKALKAIGVPIAYAGLHPKTGLHYYKIGDGLYRENNLTESITAKGNGDISPFLKACIKASKVD
ncbi:hypothetical protein [Photobacterium sp. GB-72]|uniref:hypothetical protein n=1 Tax=Photobacterium sp. GB-72 TaxID=2022105 RepID=UPI000D1595FE|nr:hypothetical protein [Photobacterium sp. GB-72]PSV30333.1 hypothetical protein C9J40_13705 [Photobacterium sp. GB-72]